jgi:hypothetical protein
MFLGYLLTLSDIPFFRRLGTDSAYSQNNLRQSNDLFHASSPQAMDYNPCSQGE